MGWQVIKQPNGKYCIFSSVVDNVVYYNCTREQIINAYINAEADSIRERVGKTIDEIDAGKKSSQFSKTFDEMINWIGEVHGSKESKRINRILKKHYKQKNDYDTISNTSY